MTYTMEDFKHDYIKKHFRELTAWEQREALERLRPDQLREVLQALPLHARLAGLSEEEIRYFLEQLQASRPTKSRKSRRKK